MSITTPVVKTELPERDITTPTHRYDVFFKATNEDGSIVLSAYRRCRAGIPAWYGLALAPVAINDPSFNEQNDVSPISLSLCYGNRDTMKTEEDEQVVLDYTMGRFYEELALLERSNWTHCLPDKVGSGTYRSTS